MTQGGIYDRLRDATIEYRHRHRLSQRKMAQRIGTSQAALSGWEQPGGTVLKEQPLTKLLELLGVEFLIPQEGNVNQSPTKGEPDRPSFLIADKLEALVKYLRSGAVTETEKIRELKVVIKGVYDALDSIRKAGDKFSDA